MRFNSIGSKLGYKTFYQNQNYHIIQEKGFANQHEMRIEVNNFNKLTLPNNAALRPYSKEILRTVGFNQYSNRPPINAIALKFAQPNDQRFTKQNFLPAGLTGVDYKQNLKIAKFRERNLDEALLAHIPKDVPSVGQYDERQALKVQQRQDLQIPDLSLYTAKVLGKTHTKQASYYVNAGNDSYDQQFAFEASINGVTSSSKKRPLALARIDKQYGRDDVMYNTIDLKTNIALENTKE